MKVYQLKSTQVLPISIEKAWDFFSDPKNLEKICPPEMNFTILEGADERMFAGQIISYKVSVLPMVRLRWVTEITHVKEGEYFVDEQRFGPYKLWHHKHLFKKVAGGVEMTDVVHYAIPLGLMGRLMNALLIAKKVKFIFEYREKRVIELFGK